LIIIKIILGGKVKIFFIGVFDNKNKSTNNSQLKAFKGLEHTVYAYNYRVVASKIGNKKRDLDMIKQAKKFAPDLLVYCKCNVVSFDVFEKMNKITKTCLWFMDPLSTYSRAEFYKKTKLVNFFVCDKLNVLKVAEKINSNSFRVCEGYDDMIDKVYILNDEHDISFIGKIYGKRKKWIEEINKGINVTSKCFGEDHAKMVSKTKINLNFCTANGASDRVYKIMAAKGFLLTDDWEGRADDFRDGEDLVLFHDKKDLNNKIEFYLNNEKERKRIAKNGHIKVQKFSRTNWAKNIIELSKRAK